MLVETADTSAVAMRIARAEWAALSEDDIRTAVGSAEGRTPNSAAKNAVDSRNATA